MNHLRVRALFLGAMVMIAMLGQAALAQHIRGALEGTVNDPQEAALPGAAVTLKSVATGAEVTSTTDAQGKFTFLNLEPGTYTLSVEAQGFRKYVATNVSVKVGSVTPIIAKLEVGEAREVVEVVANTDATVDTTRPTVDGVVTAKQIENLPLNGRNFLDLAQQEPGVQVRDGGDFDPTKNQMVGVSIGGRSGRSTRIQVDGVDITDETVGTTTTNISNEAIQEFQISRSTLDPSTDITSSGAVNIVTRSGGNEYHGSGFGFFRDERFSSDLRLDKTKPTTEKPPFDRQILGGRIGGFLIKDKLFWHGEFENNNQDGQQFTSVPLFPQFTQAFGVPLDERLAGGRLDWKITNALSSFYRFNHNYNFGVTGFGGQDTSAFGNLNNTNSHVMGLDHTTGRWTHSGRFSYLNFNNFIVDANAAAGTPTTLDPGGAPVLVRVRNALQDVGPDLLAPQTTFQDNKQVKYDGSFVTGVHTFRFGASFNHIEEAGNANFFGLAPRIRSTYNATGLAFAATHGGIADPLSFPLDQIVIGNGLGNFSEKPALGFPFGGIINNRLGLYFTDAWRWRSNLTVTLGLRYDYDSGIANSDLPRTPLLAQFNPALAGNVKNDVNNFGPQAGIAWDVKGDGKTVVRAGAGIYYESNIINNLFFDRVLNLPPGLGNVTPVLTTGAPDLLHPATGACLFRATNFNSTPGACGAAGGVNLFQQPLRNVIAASTQMQAVYQAVTAALAAGWPPPGVPPQFDQDLSTGGGLLFNQYTRPYSFMFNIGFQRELKSGLVLGVDYVHNRGVHFNQVVDRNRIGAADTLDVGIASDAIAHTNDDFGCGLLSTPAAINCAIAAGATISDYAAFGLGAGSALDGQAFRGMNPNFRDIGLIEPIGLSRYQGVTASLRGRFLREWGPIRNLTGNISYAISRFKSTGADQEFISASGFNDRPTEFYGPAQMDRTHQLSFGLLTDLPWGFKLNTTTRLASPLPQSIFLDCVDCGAGEIFMSDFDGDGVFEDPLPGVTPRGAYMRQVGGPQQLNELISAYNARVLAGELTPAGQALVTAGLFTADQLRALGGTFSGGHEVQLAPADAVGIDWFFNTDVRLSKVFTIRERVRIQPILEVFNLFNIANFDPPGNRQTSLLSGSAGSINGTTPANRSNRYGLGSGSFAPGIPRAFQFGFRVDF
jgi:hypothetical protein